VTAAPGTAAVPVAGPGAMAPGAVPGAVPGADAEGVVWVWVGAGGGGGFTSWNFSIRN
jgi:hypothetical protein